MKIPAVKYLACLITGIIAGYYITTGTIVSVIVTFSVLLLLLFTLKYDVLRRLYPFCVFITGFILIQGINENNPVISKQIIPEFKAFFKGKIVNVLSETENSSRYLISGYLNTELSQAIEKRLLLNVWNSGKKKSFIAGDSLTANLFIKIPQKLTLPTDFDEIAYARSQDFDYYGRTNSREVAVHSKGYGYQKILSDITSNIKTKLKELYSSETYPIISALITGDKSEIEYDVRKDFSITGTAHVLAVSGLHVGIISGILLVLLGWLKNRHIKFIVFTIILGFYVIITGLQPSAIRAGAMAVLIFIAFLHQRHINLLNIVSFAVIILIVIEPALILSIGFQMSVGALIGISIFMNPIAKFFDMLIPSKNSITKFFKSSLSITFSVSLVVSPIVAYYIGTYSNISPIANLIIVPLTTIAMIYGILSLCLSFLIFPLAQIYAVVAEFTINLIRVFNSYLSDFSFSQAEFNEPVILSIIISGLLAYLFFSSSSRQLIFRGIISIIIIFLSLQMINVPNENSITIHPRYNTVFVEIRTSQNNLFVILDRKPHIRQFRDYSLINYLRNKSENSKILVNGNSGIDIVDKLKEKRKVRFHELKIEEIRALFKILNLDSKIFQHINLRS